MKGKFWRKALAASLALLIVSGSVPIKPISNVFESMVVTAEAVEEYTKTFDFSTGQKSDDNSTLSLIDSADNESKSAIIVTDTAKGWISRWSNNTYFSPGNIHNKTGVDGFGVEYEDAEFIICPNVDGKVTKIEFTNAARNLAYSEEGASFVSEFSLKISGMKYNGTYDALTGVGGNNEKSNFVFESIDEGGISGNLTLILGPNSLFKFQQGSKMIITYVPDEAPAHEHSFSFNATGNTLTATCANDDGLDCSLADSDYKATLTLNAKDGYYGDHVFHGANHNCSSFNAMTGLNATVDDIVYTNKSTGETSTSPVSAVGSYTATLVVHINGTDYTLTKDFVVRSDSHINNIYPQLNISTTDFPETDHAREGEKVTLTFTPQNGESLKNLSVKGETTNYSLGNGITKVDDTHYTFIMPAETVTVTAEFKRVFSDGIGERLTGYSVSLEGDIGVNFYTELDESVAASENAYMQFTLPNSDTPKVPVSEAAQKTVGGKTYYVFKCNVSAKDMASEIKAQIIDGDKAGTEYKYSVKDYAEYILEHNEVEKYANAAPLVKSMLNYGAASQTYFKEGTPVGEVENMTDVTVPNTFKFDEVSTALPEGVTFEGATLSLKSETTLSLYFKGLPADTKFICDGKTVEATKNGEYVVARIRGIKASELENSFTVTFKGESMTYNVMAYCYNVLNGGSYDENLQNVCKALYLYAQAAKTYSE